MPPVLRASLSFRINALALRRRLEKSHAIAVGTEQLLLDALCCDQHHRKASASYAMLYPYKKAANFSSMMISADLRGFFGAYALVSQSARRYQVLSACRWCVPDREAALFETIKTRRFENSTS